MSKILGKTNENVTWYPASPLPLLGSASTSQGLKLGATR